MTKAEKKRKPRQTAVAVEPLLYDVDATCARLGGISRGKFYDEVKRKRLKTTKIGDRTFTTDDQQLDYIEVCQGGEAA